MIKFVTPDNDDYFNEAFSPKKAIKGIGDRNRIGKKIVDIINQELTDNVDFSLLSTRSLHPLKLIKFNFNRSNELVLSISYKYGFSDDEYNAKNTKMSKAMMVIKKNSKNILNKINKIDKNYEFVSLKLDNSEYFGTNAPFLSATIRPNIDIILKYKPKNITESFDGIGGYMGSDKLSRPYEYGLETGKRSARMFANASDSQDTNIDLPFDNVWNDDDYERSINEPIGKVDTNTISVLRNEKDQFSNQEDEEIAKYVHMSDSDLASEDDEDDIEGLSESRSRYWDDLF